MPQADHAERIAEMALDMHESLSRRSAETKEILKMRFGIHTGPVVAGVIGKIKFIYDLWGETVNIASRMASHGIPDCIQITAQTYERLREKYLFEQRGVISVKGDVEVSTYLLKSRAEVRNAPSQ